MNQIARYTAGLSYFTAPDGIRLAYRDEGMGLPLVTIGGINRNGIDFKYLAPHLDDVRLIRIDLRGRGASDRAPWQTYVTVQEAEDVVALLDHLGLDRAAILGTSRGGMVAMEMATFARDRLLGVCLNDIGARIETTGRETVRTNLGRQPTAKTYEDAARDRKATLTGWSDVPEGRWLDEVQILFDQTADGLCITYDPALRDALLARADTLADLWPHFMALEGLPVALIRGANSQIVSAATADEMARRMPGMIHAEVPGRGHSPWLDEPEALEAIHCWLALCHARL